MKHNCCAFCVIWIQTDCCTVVHLLQKLNVWYIKYVHYVLESCLRHCIVGVSEVDVDSIDSLSFVCGLHA